MTDRERKIAVLLVSILKGEKRFTKWMLRMNARRTTMTETDDREIEEYLRAVACCNDCGEKWPEDGSEQCPHCGSDDISTFFQAEDEDA